MAAASLQNTGPPRSLMAMSCMARSEEHTSELQSRPQLVCRLLLELYGDRRVLHSFPTRRSSDLCFFDLHFATADECRDSLPVMATCNKGVPEHQRDIQMLRADGSSFPAEYRATPKLDGDELHGAVVVFHDITAELESEKALEEARELVQEQRDQLAHTSRLTTMGEMAAGFAHEVNQPLTAISNYARVSKRMMAKDEPDLELLGETDRKSVV